MHKKIKIEVYDCICERCKHKWRTSRKIPIACAKCKSRSWNVKPNKS